MLLTKTVRVTLSNVQVRLRKKNDRKLEVEQMALIFRFIFLAKLAQFIFMFYYVFMRFYVYIICFYYVY